MKFILLIAVLLSGCRGTERTEDQPPAALQIMEIVSALEENDRVTKEFQEIVVLYRESVERSNEAEDRLIAALKKRVAELERSLHNVAALERSLQNVTASSSIAVDSTTAIYQADSTTAIDQTVVDGVMGGAVWVEDGIEVAAMQTKAGCAARQPWATDEHISYCLKEHPEVYPVCLANGAAQPWRINGPQYFEVFDCQWHPGENPRGRK